MVIDHCKECHRDTDTCYDLSEKTRQCCFEAVADDEMVTGSEHPGSTRPPGVWTSERPSYIERGCAAGKKRISPPRASGTILGLGVHGGATVLPFYRKQHVSGVVNTSSGLFVLSWRGVANSGTTQVASDALAIFKPEPAGQVDRLRCCTESRQPTSRHGSRSGGCSPEGSAAVRFSWAPHRASTHLVTIVHTLTRSDCRSALRDLSRVGTAIRQSGKAAEAGLAGSSEGGQDSEGLAPRGIVDAKGAEVLEASAWRSARARASILPGNAGRAITPAVDRIHGSVTPDAGNGETNGFLGR